MKKLDGMEYNDVIQAPARISINNSEDLYNALKNAILPKDKDGKPIEDEKLKEFCSENYETIPEKAKNDYGITDFRWPSKKITFKMFAEGIRDYLQKTKNLSKNDSKLLEIMSKRSWG